MWKALLISFLIAVKAQEDTQTDKKHLHHEVNVVSYIEVFKYQMAEYVKAQYTNLTSTEMDQVKGALEEFLQNFVLDLKEIIHGNDTSDTKDNTTNERNSNEDVKLTKEVVAENAETKEGNINKDKTKEDNVKNEKAKEDKIEGDTRKQQTEESAKEGKINDGIPDETFEEIKKKMREEFPDIDEKTANEIILRLRRNLFRTRQKLNFIIKGSVSENVDL